MLQAGGGIWVSELSRGKATTLRDDSAAVIAAVGALAASDRDAGVDVEVTEPLRRAVLSLRRQVSIRVLAVCVTRFRWMLETALSARQLSAATSTAIQANSAAPPSQLFSALTPVKALARCPCMVNSH